MIKKFVIAFVTLLALASCRMNNGDIGDFFGSWLLYSMTIDGETPDKFNPEETFWEFQNNIIEISRVDFMYDKDGRWGTWSEDDDKLVLDFTHFEYGVNPGTIQFAGPEWIGFPKQGVISLTFVSRSSKHMTLSWHDTNGRIYVYSLQKIW